MDGAGPVRIRDARDDELDALRELTLKAYTEFGRRMEPSAWRGLEQAVLGALATREPAERIVAERDGTLVGSVMLFPPAADAYAGAVARAPWPELRLLAVDPDGRGAGIGEALVRECVRRARASGARALGLHTSRSMRAAMRLYERLGFRRAPEHDFQPEGAELVTAYRLDLQRPLAERPGG